MESRSSKRLLRKTTKAPERLENIKDGSETKETFESKPDAKTKKDKQFYDVEILEVKNKMVKIHYSGYPSKYDEWRPYTEESFPVVKLERLQEPSRETLKERVLFFSGRLGREIKKMLRSHRRDDPDI